MSTGQDIIRLGLVGAGLWGRNYIRTIEKMDGVHLTRLATRNPGAADLVNDLCSISQDWQALISADDLDGLILAVPPQIQADIAMAALERRIPLLLEKPLATNTADAEHIACLAAEKNVPVMVDHIYLFHPAYIALKQAIKKLESVDSIHTISGNKGPFRKTWSPLWDWGPHDVSMCLDLVGERPQSILADCEHISTDRGTGEKFYVRLEFPCGVSAELNFGNVMDRKIRRLAVKGAGAEIVFDDQVDMKVVMSKDGKSTNIDTAPELPLGRVIDAFSRGLRGGKHICLETDLAVQITHVLAEVERQCPPSSPQ